MLPFGFSFDSWSSQSFRRIEVRERLSPSGNDGGIVHEIRLPTRLAAPRRVAILLAVGPDLGRRQLLLTLLDIGQDIAEPLVLGDRRMRPRWSLSNVL